MTILNAQKPKRLDVVVKYFYPVTAGIETNILETYSVLVEKGWDVTIHTSKDAYEKKNILPDEEMVRNLRVQRYSFGRFGFFPNIDWDSTNMVCLHNFDIFPHLRLLVYALIRKMFGKKKFSLILTPHGGFNPEWSVFTPLQAFVKRVYTYSLGVILINAAVDGVRAVSSWEKEEMIKKRIKPDLITIISNGIEDEAFADLDKAASDEIKEMVRSWGKYIIQIGRVYKIKNYETTIRALPGLDSDIRFVIIGPVANEKYLNFLKTLALSLGVENRVIFASVIRGVDKFYAISKAQCMVHMALWESFCNAVHEGLSQGLVCVVANNTALPYLVKDGINGYCVETKDFNALKERIAFILNNKNSAFIKDMENRNKTFGRQCTWRQVAASMDQWYKTLASLV